MKDASLIFQMKTAKLKYFDYSKQDTEKTAEDQAHAAEADTPAAVLAEVEAEASDLVFLNK